MPAKPSRVTTQGVSSLTAEVDALTKDVGAMDVRIKDMRGRVKKGGAGLKMRQVQEIERDWKALCARTEALRAKLTSGA